MEKNLLLVTCLLWLLNVSVSEESLEKHQVDKSDLETAATGKLLDIGGLFNKYPSYGSGRPSNGGSYNPIYGGGGYYPSNAGGYYHSVNSGYPTTGNYPQGGYGGGYYGGGYGGGYNGGGYNGGGYGSSYGGGYGGYYPQTGSGYYPPSTGRYYPPGGTNILGGGGGYGGYGGNGGLPSYYGYNDSGYIANKNLGYGYYPGTNRYGFYRNNYYSQPQYVSGYRGYD